MQSSISKSNSEHYTWGQGCDGWYLVKNEQLTVIQERMPSGTSETLHKHMKSRQFFFVLSGSAVMEHGGIITNLVTGHGLDIPPGMPHRISSNGNGPLELLVTSQPPSHGDRVELPSAEQLAED